MTVYRENPDGTLSVVEEDKSLNDMVSEIQKSTGETSPCIKDYIPPSTGD